MIHVSSRIFEQPRGASKCVCIYITMILTFFASTKGISYSSWLTDVKQDSEFSTVSIPFQIIGKLIIVKATVDGKTGNYIVDSGANLTIVNSKYYQKKGHQNPNKSYGLNGQITSSSTSHAPLEWYGVYRKWIELTIIDLSDIENALKTPIHGLIGYDVLHKFEVVIDYQMQMLTLTRNHKNFNIQHRSNLMREPDFTFHMRLNRHFPCVSVFTTKAKLWIGIDSGSAINILSPALRKSLHDSRPLTSGPLKLVGLGRSAQTEDVYLAGNFLIDGTMPIADVKLVYHSIQHMNSALAFAMDGVLGFDFLKNFKVGINYRNREIKLWTQKPKVNHILITNGNPSSSWAM